LKQLRHARPGAVIAEHAYVPFLEELSVKGPRIVLSGKNPGWVGYAEFLRSGAETEPPVEILPEDPYNIIYSSGTTGLPKGIVHTHRARVLFALTCGLEFRIHNETVTCIATPLYSNGTQLTFLPTLLAGGTVTIMESFQPDALLQTLEQGKCTHVFMVPTQYTRVMGHPDFGRYDTSSVEMLVSAAAPLGEKTRKQILKQFPKSRLAELYGLTEGVSTILRPDEQLLKPGSVGKPRMGGDVKIIDDDGNELPKGKTGEIVASSVSMMRGYYRNRKATRNAAWRDGRGRTYLKTGDLGRIDRDGYLVLKDRKKDLIISGGFNIYPSDIEDLLLRHPAVAEAAVIGMAHKDWGESPFALVVKKDPGWALSPRALLDWANRRLSGYQKISRLEFVASLPRNDLGKILKKDLRRSCAALRNPA
jgi:acyl-CoA synthetase (AMP-forming)/AMP-acid ligase II